MPERSTDSPRRGGVTGTRSCFHLVFVVGRVCRGVNYLIKCMRAIITAGLLHLHSKKKVKGWRLRSLSKHDCTKGGNPPPNLPDNLFDSGVSFRVGRIVFFLMSTVSQNFQMGMPWSNVKVQLKPVFVSKKEIYFLIILSFLPRARRQSRPYFFFLCFI